MKKFIILSTQRSGTEMLRRALDAEDDIFCSSEVICNDARGLDTLKDFFSLYDYMVKPPKAFGCKVMINQLSPEIEAYLAESDIKIIWLVRDIKDVIVSDYINNNKDKFHGEAHSHKACKGVKTEIPLYYAKMAFDRIQYELSIGEALADYKIYYEDVVPVDGKMLRNTRGLFKFLGVEDRVIKTDIVKQNDGIALTVINYSEYIKFFDENTH